MNNLVKSTIAGAALLLIACGGGNEVTATPIPTPVPTLMVPPTWTSETPSITREAYYAKLSRTLQLVFNKDNVLKELENSLGTTLDPARIVLARIEGYNFVILVNDAGYECRLVSGDGNTEAPADKRLIDWFFQSIDPQSIYSDLRARNISTEGFVDPCFSPILGLRELPEATQTLVSLQCLAENGLQPAGNIENPFGD